MAKEIKTIGVLTSGGDGSFMGARALANQGIPCVGIPGTIDNDIACSEYTIGSVSYTHLDVYKRQAFCPVSWTLPSRAKTSSAALRS